MRSQGYIILDFIVSVQTFASRLIMGSALLNPRE
jgi:hypothetical protein